MKISLCCRLWVLALVMILGYSVVFILPDSGAMRPSLLKTELPESINNWVGERVKVSGRELDILAKDTDFERKSYKNTNLKNHFGVEVSIVFSGEDMNNSIHRPEVCLRAQGWNFVDERYLEVSTDIAGFESIPMKQIICERLAYEDKKPIMGVNGKQMKIRRILYYTFFGHTNIVAGHFERVANDMKDRVLGGYDQRWAYATFGSTVSQTLIDEGFWKPGAKGFNDKETKASIEEVVRLIAQESILRSK